MLKKLQSEPEKLISMVTSKGGTTLAGLQILKNYDLRKIMSDTVEAAAKRATELGKMGEK